MAEKILVELKKGDGAGEIVPYIEQVAKPGTKVVFLVHYPVAGPMVYLGWGRDNLMTPKSRAQGAAASKALGRKFSWEDQVQLAGEKILPACGGLRAKGVEIAIDLYGNYEDSFKKAVDRHTRNGGVQLIMTRPGIGLRITNFLQETVGLLGLRKRPSFSPVLVVHPSPRVLG